MNGKNVFVAGHRGMVGSAICRELIKNKKVRLITADRSELDLKNQLQVDNFFELHSIDEVYLAAAKVGGIHANNEYPADFLYDNMLIESNVINASHKTGVQKLLFLGSSCIYPKYASQPIVEESLLTGPLEPTNEPYALAKIAGIKLCESYNRQYGRDYRSVMPTNLYGIGDNYHAVNSHVIPGLIRRFHEAVKNNQSSVDAWGTGKPKREFLYVNDLAEAVVHIMGLEFVEYKKILGKAGVGHINIGSGTEITIKQLTELIAKVVGFHGNIKWDENKPDGTPRKLMDSTRAFSTGWSPKVSLENGLQVAYEDFLAKLDSPEAKL